MMNFFKEWRSYSLIKLIGIGVLGIIIFVVAVWLIGFAFRSAFYGGVSSSGGYRGAPEPAFYDDYEYDAYQEEFGMAQKMVIPSHGLPVDDGFTSGVDAEDFEVTEYTGSIKTGNLDRVCGTIEGLKQSQDIIFEQAERYENGCHYVFKVANDTAEETLAVIEELDPEELVARTETIKGRVDDFTNEIDILERKLISVEKTLTDAQQAYDEVTRLATRTQDVESLAKIIDSRINLIERLTQERITITERIDRLHRAQEEQLDRLNFTFFRIDVWEFLILDGEELKNSWLFEAQRFVDEFNRVIQGITINLAGYLLRLIQVALYILLALLVIKYGWRLVKRLWKA